MKLIKDVKKIASAIASIKRRGTKLQNDSHIAACSVLAHFHEHKDIRLVNDLINALPLMARRNALRAWFEAHAPIAFEMDDNKEAHAVYAKDRAKGFEYKQALETGIATPFWQFEPEKPYVPVDALKLIKGVISKLEKDQKEVEEADHSDMITKLKDMLSTDA